MSHKFGKAKRQRLARQAKCGRTTIVTAVTGEQVEARHAGMTYSEASRYATDRADKPNEVPCNGCRACCHGSRIEVDTSKEPPERLKHLDLVPDPHGDMRLRRREEDGACVHLGERGCTIYEHRPEVCRSYDCRMWSRIGIRRTYDTPHGAVLEPAWLFDIETRNDEIEEIVAGMLAEGFQENGIPENPHEFSSLLQTAYSRLKRKTREAFDQFDKMTPEERATLCDC
jgi:Fe-S-cluster containining protein